MKRHLVLMGLVILSSCENKDPRKDELFPKYCGSYLSQKSGSNECLAKDCLISIVLQISGEGDYTYKELIADDGVFISTGKYRYEKQFGILELENKYGKSPGNWYPAVLGGWDRPTKIYLEDSADNEILLRACK